MALRFFIVVFFAVMVVSSPAFAQESEAHKIELARKMHEVRPTRRQVEQAIAIVAQRVPEEKRAAFQAALSSSLDFKAVEKVSMDAMVETFTEKELESMVDYYSKPEAQSASDKLPQYQQKVGPEIIRMIDKAMMKVKTGQ